MWPHSGAVRDSYVLADTAGAPSRHGTATVLSVDRSRSKEADEAHSLQVVFALACSRASGDGQRTKRRQIWTTALDGVPDRLDLRRSPLAASPFFNREEVMNRQRMDGMDVC